MFILPVPHYLLTSSKWVGNMMSLFLDVWITVHILAFLLLSNWKKKTEKNPQHDVNLIFTIYCILITTCFLYEQNCLFSPEPLNHPLLSSASSFTKHAAVLTSNIRDGFTNIGKDAPGKQQLDMTELIISGICSSNLLSWVHVTVTVPPVLLLLQDLCWLSYGPASSVVSTQL